jgi:hypothetical protein
MATNRLSTAARGNWQDCAHPPPATAIAYMLSRQATRATSESRRRQCECLQVASRCVAGKRRACVALADEIWVGRRQTPDLVAATVASATDAPCGYACRGVCERLMDCPRLARALTGIEWLVRRRLLIDPPHTTPQPISLAGASELKR